MRKPALRFIHAGQLGFIVELGGARIGLDLFLSPMKGRLVKPQFRLDEVMDIDFFIGSHDHADHIDRPMWRELVRLGCKAKFIVPASVAAAVARATGLKHPQIIGMTQDETVTIAGVRITAIASAHERIELDRSGRAQCLGFVLERNGVKIYHSGDCCPYEGLQSRLARFGRFTAAFLPINGRDAWRLSHDFIGCMDAHEAVELAGELGVRTLVPGHHDMFKPNLGDIRECVAFAKIKYPRLKVLPPITGKIQTIS